MRKITSSILVSALLMPSFVMADDGAISCAYSWKYDQCRAANDSWTARSIEDFECLESIDGEEILLQIILDEKMKEVDQEAEDYLQSLEESKEEYFWEQPKKSFLSAVDDINHNFAQYEYFWKEYQNICHSEVLNEFLTCSSEITNIEATNFLSGWDDSKCMAVSEIKLSAYMFTAYNILKLSRWSVRADARKLYTIEQRGKYGILLDIMRGLIGYMERLLNGWETKTKHPHT